MEVRNAIHKNTFFPSGSQTASAIALDGYQLVALYLPTELSGLSATFNVALAAGESLRPLHSAAVTYKVPVQSAAWNALDVNMHLSYNVLQVCMTGTAQGTALFFSAIIRPLAG